MCVHITYLPYTTELSYKLLLPRPGWERHHMPCICHIKNTRKVCHTSKRLYGVLPHLLLIHDFIHS